MEEVEIVHGLEKREARAAHEARDPGLLPLRDLLGDDAREEIAIRPLLQLGPGASARARPAGRWRDGAA
jgi:hypothetical protein